MRILDSPQEGPGRGLDEERKALRLRGMSDHCPAGVCYLRGGAAGEGRRTECPLPACRPCSWEMARSRSCPVCNLQ